MGLVVDSYRFTAAGPTFDPDSIAGLELWLDASDAATITESAGDVSQWDDKSGAGNNVTASGSTKPSTGVNTINSKNVIDMAADEFFTLTPSSGICAANMTILMVYRKTGANNSFEAVPLLLDDGSNQGAPLDGWDNGTDQRLYIGNNSATGYASVRSHTTATQVTIIGQKDSGGANTHAVTQRVNGTQNNTANIVAGWSATSQRIRIGLRSDGATKFTGDIAEILVYNAVLSGTDLTDAEAYLATKWGTP